MYNLRNELIKTIIKSLKIDDNPFNVITIQDMIQNIDDNNLQGFYQALFGNEHSFLNGLDRVAKVAEQFKPLDTAPSELEAKAKELIALVHGMNEAIYQKHIESGVRFDDLLQAVKFPSVDDETIAILNQVKPHHDLKSLIGGINHYQTTQEQLKAFTNALKYTPTEIARLGVANKLQIKG